MSQLKWERTPEMREREMLSLLQCLNQKNTINIKNASDVQPAFPMPKIKFLTTFTGQFCGWIQYSWLGKNRPINNSHSEERKVWKRVQDRVWDFIQFHHELRPGTAPRPVFCAKIFTNLKSKAVIHHYLDKHLLHVHFKVCSTFLLLFWGLEPLYAEKSSRSTQS